MPAALLPAALLAATLLSAALLLSGCAGLSDALFLLRRLDDPAKARALTEQGVAGYQLYLVKRGEYDRLAEVRSFFEVALRYDPANQKAKAYLELVDGYRSTETRKRVREAEQLLKKGKRGQEEDYALCVAVARAWQLAPEGEEVSRLHTQTAEVRVELTTLYLERSRTTRAQVKEGTPPATREKLFIEAFRDVNRVLAIDPGNRAARSEAESLRPTVNGIFAGRLEQARQLIAKSSFTEARREAALLEELNRRLEHAFDREVADLAYSLNYRWAKSLYERRDYTGAEIRLDAALAVRRTEEAAGLKRRIAQARAKSEAGSTFETGLAEVDRLLAQGDLAGAFRRSERLAQSTQDRARLAALEERRERIRRELPGLYAKAVDFYRAEDFGKAVQTLEVVVAIDVEYEQAAEYLDKAKTKQALLRQYGGEE
jgi:hypothetical protein